MRVLMRWLWIVVLVACRADAPRCPAEPPAAPAGAHPAGRELIYDLLATWDRGEADAILADDWSVPRFEPAHLPPPIDWAADPYGEKYWRFVFLGFRPARNLLGAYLDTHDARYRDKLVAFLDDFTAHTPCVPDGTKLSRALFDPHTAAFRAMMIVRFYFALGDELPAELAARLRTHLAGLGAFLATDRGFQEHANHAVTQLAALYLIGVEFPDWPESPAWRRLALARLSLILRSTVDADGAQIEQSPTYHFYELGFLEEIARWAARFDVPMPPELPSRLAQMHAFGAAIRQPDGYLPALGGTGSRATVPDDLLDPLPTESRLFETAGFAILRAPGAHVVFDVGPYRTNHSDLDALSVHVFGGGRRLLVDSGFYSLEPGPWRDYFHGTRGHNTVVVDGRDQREGTAHALAFVTAPGRSAALGESALTFGVIHDRAVVLIDDDLLVVFDELRAAAPHHYDQRWHLDDALHAEPFDGGARGVDADGHVAFQLVQATPGTPAVIRGADDPPDGWIVDQYEKAIPADVLSFAIDAEDAQFATVIAFGDRATLPTTITFEGAIDDGEIVVVSGSERFAIDLATLN